MKKQKKAKHPLKAKSTVMQQRVTELERQNRAQARQLKALARERDLLRALVYYLPNCHIFLKDRNSRFMITNRFELQVLDKKDIQAVIGRTDFDLFPRELAEQYYRDEQQVVRSAQPVVDREEKTVDRAGQEYWLLTTKIPLFLHKGKIVTRDDLDETLPQAAKKVIGIIGLSRDITARKKLEAERERLIVQLHQAIADIKTLRGLVPICAACKKIRDDQGYWHQVESYLTEHSQAKFTHGVCPDCAKKILADFKSPDNRG